MVQPGPPLRGRGRLSEVGDTVGSSDSVTTRLRRDHSGTAESERGQVLEHARGCAVRAPRSPGDLGPLTWLCGSVARGRQRDRHCARRGPWTALLWRYSRMRGT
eukprot:171555-Rhodomonas_salina.2